MKAPSPCPEPLEARIAPAKLFAIDTNNHILTFDSATPGTIDAFVAITGLVDGSGETIVGIDVRPATSELYALGVKTAAGVDDLRLYRLDPVTGAATHIGSVINVISVNSVYGFDFNPTSDRIRVVSDTHENLRINPDTGARADSPANDTDLNPLSNTITAVAYDRNFPGSVGNAAGTTLYGIDTANDQLVLIGGLNQNPSPNLGAVTNVGSLGANVTGVGGFDIQGVNTALAVLTIGGVTGLSTINLTTGALTPIGPVGTGTVTLSGFTVAGPEVKFPNAKTATYVDADGDLVTIKVTKGTLGRSDIGLALPLPGALGGQLTILNLFDDGDEFNGTNITISAKRSATGDGLVNVGRIDSSGHDLGTVIVKGALADIFAGDSANTTGLVKLVVNTFGGPANPVSPSTIPGGQIVGKALTVQVLGDMRDTSLLADALGNVTVGGSIIATVSDQAVFSSSAGIDSFTLKGHLVGGPGNTGGAGRIEAQSGDIGRLTIGGSIVGGVGESGSVFCNGTIKQALIKGSLIGGTGAVETGNIRADAIGTLTIGGSIVGGSGDRAGGVFSLGDIGTLKIAGHLIGPSIIGTANGAILTAAIQSGGTIGNLQIGGSIVAGTDLATANLLASPSISAFSGIGKMTVKGSILGNPSNPISIIVTHDVPAIQLALGTLTVGGSVEHARILAGFDVGLAPETPDVHIGTVTVNGHWVASSLVAGVRDSGNDGFGVNDAVIAGGDPGITSRIAKVVIKGTAFAFPLANNFGFVAQEIGSLMVSGRKFIFTPGPGNDLVAQFVGTTGNVRVVEFA
jgi:hypothetical protein